MQLRLSRGMTLSRSAALLTTWCLAA